MWPFTKPEEPKKQELSDFEKFLPVYSAEFKWVDKEGKLLNTCFYSIMFDSEKHQARLLMAGHDPKSHHGYSWAIGELHCLQVFIMGKTTEQVLKAIEQYHRRKKDKEKDDYSIEELEAKIKELIEKEEYLSVSKWQDLLDKKLNKT